MPSWIPTIHFCRICQQWCNGNHFYQYCPAGGGMLWFDTESFFTSCGSCRQVWAAISGSYFCNFGHQQQVEFLNAPINIESGNQLLYTDSNVSYILKQNGILIVGRPMWQYQPINRPETFKVFEQIRQKTPDETAIPKEFIETVEIRYMKILELSKNHTIAEIKQKYKAKITKVHPDKVQNLSEVIQVAAEQETHKINEAYAFFKKKLNFS